MGAYAAQVSCAVCGDYRHMAIYREILAPPKNDTGNATFIALICRASALGFA